MTSPNRLPQGAGGDVQAIVDGLVDGLVGEAVDGLCGRVRGHRRRLFSRGAQDSDPAGWDYSPAGSPPEGRRRAEDRSPPDTEAPPRQEPCGRRSGREECGGSWTAEKLRRGRWVVGAWVCRAVRGGVRPSRRRAAGVAGVRGRRGAPRGDTGNTGPDKGPTKRLEKLGRSGEGRAVRGSQERRGPGGGRISP